MRPIAYALTGALALVLAVPTAQAKEGNDAVLMKTLSNPFWGAMAEGIKAGAGEAGVSVNVQAVESDQAAESQLNVCNTMLQRSPDALITAAINSTNLLPCIQQAIAADIPVADLDGNLDPQVLEKAGIDIAFAIGSDNVEAGQKAADWLVSELGKEAKGPVLVIEGLSGNITGQRRVRGFTERLAESGHGLQVVASLPGDWDRGKAATITTDTLTRSPDLVAVFAANDGMALGAVEAAYAAGKGDQVTVIGVDGNSDAVESIKKGRLDASVAQLPYLVGRKAVVNMQKVKNGEKVESFIAVPTLMLTKEVLEKGENPLLRYVR